LFLIISLLLESTASQGVPEIIFSKSQIRVT
jgi:hypothetical protein